MTGHAFGRNVLVWLALLALLAISAGSAFLPLGSWNGVVNLAIAGLKLALVAVFFMHLLAGRAAIRLALLVGFLMFGLLFVLAAADYGTRQFFPAAWEVPRQIAPMAPGR